jgi:hypothetical protein
MVRNSILNVHLFNTGPGGADVTGRNTLLGTQARVAMEVVVTDQNGPLVYALKVL